MASVAKRRWNKADGTIGEKWTVRYKDGMGSYRSQSFEKKKDADGFRAKVELDLRSGDHIAPGQSKTVEAAASMLLDHVDAQAAHGKLRPTTAKNYHSAFRQAVLPFIGHKLVLDVKAEDLEVWFHKVVRDKRMTPATAFRRLWYIKEMFRFAMRRRWCNHNPAVAAMENLGRPRDGKIKTFDVEAVRKVIAAAGERAHRARERPFAMTRLAVHLAAFCGLRWGEIFGLTSDAIDLEKGTIRVRHSLDGLGNLQEPKTKAGLRNVPMPRHIVEMLAAYLARWPSANPSRIVLHAAGGQSMRATNFRTSAWLPLQSRAGVLDADGRNIRFHALRHFACSWMIENGWPIPDVSALLGHANVTVTLQVYAHTLKGAAKSADAMQQLAEKLLAECADKPVLALTHDAPITHDEKYAAILTT